MGSLHEDQRDWDAVGQHARAVVLLVFPYPPLVAPQNHAIVPALSARYYRRFCRFHHRKETNVSYRDTSSLVTCSIAFPTLKSSTKEHRSIDCIVLMD